MNSIIEPPITEKVEKSSPWIKRPLSPRGEGRVRGTGLLK